jgi:hypothetical protein
VIALLYILAEGRGTACADVPEGFPLLGALAQAQLYIAEGDGWWR